jgi:hypothetical protein
MRARAVDLAGSREPISCEEAHDPEMPCTGPRATIAFHICDVLMKRLVE